MIIPSFEAQTEWIEPEEYPDLRSYDEIAIDLETRDPELKTRGSGSVIGWYCCCCTRKKILFSNCSWLWTKHG
jgi:hypothetical protein